MLEALLGIYEGKFEENSVVMESSFWRKARARLGICVCVFFSTCLGFRFRREVLPRLVSGLC